MTKGSNFLRCDSTSTSASPSPSFRRGTSTRHHVDTLDQSINISDSLRCAPTSISFQTSPSIRYHGNTLDQSTIISWTCSSSDALAVKMFLSSDTTAVHSVRQSIYSLECFRIRLQLKNLYLSKCERKPRIDVKKHHVPRK